MAFATIKWLVIDEHGGWFFAQRLSAKAREMDSRKMHIAEFWANDRFKAVLPPPNGLGFDAAWHDGLRGAIRQMISESAGGRDAHVHLDELADHLRHGVYNTPFRWQAVEYVESHDVIDLGHDDRQPRIPGSPTSTIPIPGMRRVDRGWRRASCSQPPGSDALHGSGVFGR